MNAGKELSPWPLQDRLFPPVLTIQQFKCFQTHLCLSGTDPFQLPAEPGSATHRSLPLPTQAVGALLHPCTPHPPLQTGLQDEHM